LTCAIEHLKKQAQNVAERKSIEENIAGWEYKPLPYLLATTNLILHDIEVPNIKFGDALRPTPEQLYRKTPCKCNIGKPTLWRHCSQRQRKQFSANLPYQRKCRPVFNLNDSFAKQGGRAGIVLPDGSLTGDGVKQRVRQKLLEDCNLHTIIRLPNSLFNLMPP
jgi:type I restriction enzyme M protein